MSQISVVIPYFNRQRFIADCLESVLRQSLPPLEVIVVDDGSSPAERRYLDKFLPSVRIIELAKNQGVSAARNAGIQAARGAWIAFNDSDDRWVSHKLATQWEHVQRHPDCDGVHTAIRTFYADGRESVSDPIAPRLTIEAALHDNMIRMQSLLIRASALRAVDGFDERFRLCEDEDLGIRLAKAGFVIDFLPEPLTEMRRGNYSHLWRDWHHMIRAKVDVALHHRSLHEQVLGRGATRRRIARAVRKVGSMRGGVVGRLVFAGGWVLGGLDRETE